MTTRHLSRAPDMRRGLASTRRRVGERRKGKRCSPRSDAGWRQVKVTLRLVLKWTLLVPLSAVASFVAALLTDYAGAVRIVAMLAGIATFIVLYACIEAWAVARGHENLLRSLKVGVIIKIALQLAPTIELGAGYI